MPYMINFAHLRHHELEDGDAVSLQVVEVVLGDRGDELGLVHAAVEELGATDLHPS